MQLPYYQLQQQQQQLEKQSVGSVEAAAESGYPLQVPYYQLLQQQQQQQEQEQPLAENAAAAVAVAAANGYPLQVPYYQLLQQQQQEQWLEENAAAAGYPMEVPYYHVLQQQQEQQLGENAVAAAAAAGYPLQVPYNQLLQHHHHHQKEQEQQQKLEAFWALQLKEINETNNFKNNKLPLARVKRLMKDNEDVCKVSGKAPMLMAKVCEMFIQELTLRSWFNTKENKRRIVQKKDVAKAIERTELVDFLVDIGRWFWAQHAWLHIK
ncbi:hypothetical protein P3S67_006514 [Capsicum chacoense]